MTESPVARTRATPHPSARVARWKRRFLRCLRLSPNVAAACTKAGVSRQTVYRQREQDPEFAAEWKECIEAACDELEAVAFSLAKRGDQQLLTWLLRNHRPQTYRETTRQEHAVLGKIVFMLPEKEQRDA